MLSVPKSTGNACFTSISYQLPPPWSCANRGGLGSFVRTARETACRTRFRALTLLVQERHPHLSPLVMQSKIEFVDCAFVYAPGSQFTAIIRHRQRPSILYRPSHSIYRVVYLAAARQAVCSIFFPINLADDGNVQCAARSLSEMII